MSHRFTCAVCDSPMSAYGVGGTRCERCSEPCQTCGKDVANCQHPLRSDGKPNGTFAQWYLDENPELAERLTEVEHLEPRKGRSRVAA